MDIKKINNLQRRLENDYDKLLKSISRNRTAVEEIRLENTDDEGDLATISHNRDVLYNLHESDFGRLRLIQQALKAIGRGNYGECVGCGEDINDKRLEAVPWATMCIHCQEHTEAESVSSRMVLAGQETEETE